MVSARSASKVSKTTRAIVDQYTGRGKPPSTGAPKPPLKATPLTATQRTQSAGNQVKLREAARRNANPGMSAQQANEMERHSGLMATLPKNKNTKTKKSK